MDSELLDMMSIAGGLALDMVQIEALSCFAFGCCVHTGLSVRGDHLLIRTGDTA